MPCGGERRIHINFHESKFWGEIAITARPYDSSRSKSSALPNPIFWYLHRVMANTIFGCGDSEGVVCQSELIILWAMINDVNIDTGSHFIRHLVKIRKGSAGAIIVGGLITA